MKKTHDVCSACASSAIRCYYAVQLARSNDVTYHVGLMVLWTVPEVASGILAMCLPVSPKFFRHIKDSNLWSGPKSFIFSFWRPKTEAKWPTDTYAAAGGGENKTPKLQGTTSDSNKVKGNKKYNILSDGIELVTKTSNDGSGQSTRDEEIDETLSKGHNRPVV